MNLTDQINQFFEAGVAEIKIYRPKEMDGGYLVQATQANAQNLVNALEDIRRRVNFCNEQAAKINLE